jgi:hypothetical protein
VQNCKRVREKRSIFLVEVKEEEKANGTNKNVFFSSLCDFFVVVLCPGVKNDGRWKGKEKKQDIVYMEKNSNSRGSYSSFVFCCVREEERQIRERG